uniref:Ribose-5-phosphate isomerase n=1 Tax=Mycena chlorophos TaxID=658473 RepID=A0ABQ0M6E0_MYCCL|nr:ribose-5-phosphate isomerase [Mycena chlorophos]
MPLPTPLSPVSPISKVRPVVLSRIGQPTKLISPITDLNLSVLEKSKQLAAWTAVDQHVKPEHRVIGIGSGSTVPYVVERIVQLGAEANAERVFIPTGFQSKQLIVSSGLNLGDVDQFPTIDVTLDGADEVDRELNCIKGGGACHLREKVLAEAANTFILVADYRKNVEFLGTNFASGIPIEVVPFAYAKVLQNLHHHLGCPQASLRMAVKKAGPVVSDNGNFIIDAPYDQETMKTPYTAGPVVSDNGNFIIDAPYDQETMKTPYTIMAQIKMLTGVVEVGVFCHMARAAYFGNADGTVTIKWNDGRVEEVAAQA